MELRTQCLNQILRDTRVNRAGNPPMLNMRGMPRLTAAWPKASPSPSTSLPIWRWRPWEWFQHNPSLWSLKRRHDNKRPWRRGTLAELAQVPLTRVGPTSDLPRARRNARTVPMDVTHASRGARHVPPHSFPMGDRQSMRQSSQHSRDCVGPAASAASSRQRLGVARPMGPLP